ncbi:hypothetical protein K0M31_011599 [Melipona bicolor]|uniref:Uncharacterized protein n=1 Tax=Melipona bicolor TaxID=60889 RepID=A0AA40GB33_9HYME|nr:hypothetical protein K0M31_011599 [Melipona bicolor]
MKRIQNENAKLSFRRKTVFGTVGECTPVEEETKVRSCFHVGEMGQGLGTQTTGIRSTEHCRWQPSEY